MLDYRPNTSARRLAGNRAYLIGLLYDNPGTSYITNIQNGALEACRREHYDILIFPLIYTDGSLSDQVSELITSVKVDGVLLTPPICDMKSVSDELERLNAPSVAISPGEDNRSEWKVETNDREICSQMVHHLAELGHQRIAFVLGNPDHRAVENRLLGFRDGMEQCNLPIHEELCVQGDYTFQSGIECAHQLLTIEPRPTAVFCANDDMAMGVLRVAHEMGLSIPSDLSVAGFDDVPVARQSWPLLTTIRQPTQSMAELAGRLLINRIRGLEPMEEDRVLQSELVIRDSTGPAPKS